MNKQLEQSKTQDPTSKIRTAVLLAAGMGKRLRPLSEGTPKCLTKVNDTEMLGRLVNNLISNDFQKLIVIVGHCHEQIKEYLGEYAGSLQVEYIYCPDFSTTNNIVSLWTARNVINEPFVLFESDLIFEPELIEAMTQPGRIAVSERLPWMNGTTVTVNPLNPSIVDHFNMGEDALNPTENDYKTVNICSFSLLQWKQVAKGLDVLVQSGMVQEYYETVFASLVADRSIEMVPVYFDNEKWYEVDKIEDLAEAEKMFAKVQETMAA